MVGLLRRIRLLSVRCYFQGASWFDGYGPGDAWNGIEELAKETMSRDVFVVGGGPSLTGFNFHVLDGKDTIAINQALFRLPSAKFFATMDFTWRLHLDESWEREHKQAFLKHPAHKVFAVGFTTPRLVKHSTTCIEDTEHHLKYDLSDFNQVTYCNGYGGIGTTWEDFRVGSESGYAGLQLAVLLGYTKIYLLGFDFRITPYQTHFHQDYLSRDPVEFQRRLNDYYTPYPNALFQIRQMGIEIFSCSPISRLNQHLLYVDVESLVCQH